MMQSSLETHRRLTINFKWFCSAVTVYIINMIAKCSKVGICPLTTTNSTSNFKIWSMCMKKSNVLDILFCL